jgi:hypothetical protein
MRKVVAGRSVVVGVFALALLTVPAFAQTTTYTYTGAPYTIAAAPYVVGGQLTGTFITANPLPAFLPLTDIRPSLQSVSFNDGAAARTLANSFVCAFKVATNGVGNITQWEITLRQSPYTTGNPQHSIDSSGRVGVIFGTDLVGTGNAGVNPCDPIVLSPSANTSAQGAWTDTFNQPSQPTSYTYTGDPYTNVTAPYVLGGQLTGSFTTANPLPPFLPLTDITPALTTMSFNDGIESRGLANSFLCSFKVATDGLGRITQWDVQLTRFPYNPGDPHHSINSSGTPGVLEGNDLSGTGTAGADPCDPMVLASYGGTATEGTWTDTNPLTGTPTTYNYTGDPYTTALAPYVLGNNLTGSITTANPLPPFLPLTDITPALTSLSFNDSVETRTLANSFLCSVKVATDGAGNITQWSIDLARSPYNPGDPHHKIGSSGQPGAIEGNDLVGTGPAPAGPCDPFALTIFASTATQGTWTDTNPLASQPTVYNYTGDPFTSAVAPYAIGGSVTGTITVANPLPPFMPLTDITTALTSLTFADGIQVRTLANTFLCTFRVATDGAGNITQWQVLLRQSPFTPLNPQQSIDSSGNPGGPEGTDLAGTGTAGAGPCDPMALAQFGSTGTQGTWSTAAASVGDVPMLDGFGLALLSVLLAAMAVWVLRVSQS